MILNLVQKKIAQERHLQELSSSSSLKFIAVAKGIKRKRVLYHKQSSTFDNQYPSLPHRE